MTKPKPNLALVTITIHRVFTEDGGDQVWAEFADRDGEMPPLVEILGMLELTKDTAIRACMEDNEEDE